MVEFELVWMSEDGDECRDTGRAPMEKINKWNAEIRRCKADGDESTKITIPTDGDGDWSGSRVRAILVQEVKPKAQRPTGEGW